MSRSDNADIRGSPPVRSRDVTSFHCLTFLTDYGLENGFVAACHRVCLQVAPNARIIDITHLVPPWRHPARRRRPGADRPYPAGGACRGPSTPVWAPPGARSASPLAALVFVGPDNGLLSWAVESGRRRQRRGIPHQQGALAGPGDGPPSTDATSSCRLGGAPGPRACPSPKPARNWDVASLVRLPMPEKPASSTAVSRGEVVTVDRFGNARALGHRSGRGPRRNRPGRDGRAGRGAAGRSRCRSGRPSARWPPGELGPPTPTARGSSPIAARRGQRRAATRAASRDAGMTLTVAE